MEEKIPVPENESENKKENEMSESEKRIRAITKLYYSNPGVQKALLEFAKNREVVPRYFEGFGKRPDAIQYVSDIMGLVNKGATSFHASEEIWHDPLALETEMSQEKINKLRKSWDLLIDIDSKYLDVSKEAAKLVIELLEKYGIKYGIKFSGSKGMHIIVSGDAFPSEFEGMKMNESFPEWPRAITEYIFFEITPEFRKRVGKIMSLSTIEKESQETRICCMQCSQKAQKGILSRYECKICGAKMERRQVKQPERKLRCVNGKCRGILEIADSEEYYFCENCRDFENEKLQLASNKYPEMFKEIRGEFAEEHAELDLVLVAQRHLFRMPYSLHEKTALASIVLTKEQIENFHPRDADPMKVKIKEFLAQNEADEAKKLLADALKWKKEKTLIEQEMDKKRYGEKRAGNTGGFEEFKFENVNEKDFPIPIKKLLKGLKDGKKRGLFILITFLRSINFSNEEIASRINEWNKLNEPQLKEGYIKSQLNWHFRQKRRILPPNYANANFYKDLNLLDEKPDAKNPISELMRKLRKG